jgi:hypothetical protein
MSSTGRKGIKKGVNPWVKTSASGLKVPEGLYSPVAKYFGTTLKTEYEYNCLEKSKFYKFISKQRIVSLMHSSILRRIWLNFMEQYLGFFFRLLHSFHNCFRISNFFCLSTTEETWVVEMRIWCIKICIVLVLRFHYHYSCPWRGYLVQVFVFSATCFNVLSEHINIQSWREEMLVGQSVVFQLPHRCVHIQEWR